MIVRLLSLLLVGVLTLAAHSAEPLFPGAGGDYGGIIEDSSGAAPDNSGIVTAALKDTGSVSVKLVWQNQAYSYKGVFASDGKFTKSGLRKKNPAVAGTTVELTVLLTLTADTRTIDGTLTDPENSSAPIVATFQLSGQVPDPALTAQLDPGLRLAFIDPTVTSAAAEGVPEGGASGPAVTEDGFAVVTIGKTARRSSRFAGRLPDTQAYSAGSPLRGAQYALRSGLYQQRKVGAGGQLLGNGSVASTSFAPSESAKSPQSIGSAAALIAALRWHKKANVPGTNAYPGSINQRVDLDTVGYTPDRDMSYVLTGSRNSFSNAKLRMQRGNLSAEASHDPIQVALNVTIFGAKVVGLNPHNVKLKVSPLTAKFTGSFKHPDTLETIKFGGAFRSFFGVVPGEGRGNFLSAPVRDDPSQSRSGSVRITIE